MRGICIINESLYKDVVIRNIIFQKFQGVCFAGKQEGFDFWVNNQIEFNRSMDLNGSNVKEFPSLTAYFDEPISTPDEYNKDWKDYCANNNAVVGETFRNIRKVKKSFITLTTYTTLLVFSQLFKWRILHLLYGNRFKMVWIKLGQKNITALTKWAESKGKDVWYYSELNKEELINELVKL